MMKNRGIAFKLILLILTSSTLIFISIFWYNYKFSRRIILTNIEQNAINLAGATVNKIDMMLRPVEKVAENLSFFLESTSFSGGEIIALLRSAVKKNPEIYGASIAFEPYAYDQNALCFAPYFYRNNGKIKFTYLGDEKYRYFNMDWYQIPKELDSPTWSEPYYDEGGGNIVMSTYSVPFYKKIQGEKIFMGIVTADISLSWLQNIVSSIKIAESGYGFLISKNGTFVTHPDEQIVMNETIFSVAEASEAPSLREIGRRMVKGKSGFIPVTSLVTKKKCWMVYAPLSSSGWSLGVLFPRDEMMADVSRLAHTVIILIISGFLFLLIVVVLIAGSITRPLSALVNATEEIATGNMEADLPPIKSMDEVGKLTHSFHSMKDSLKKYIEDLTNETAARERIESELNIAHDIQMGILPKTFPPFPERPEFDIYATIEPAKEVGGDLYDFFFMDENHLCFTVGDVSGKGVPAALLMAVTRTLIKTKATKGLSPAKVLSRVNEDLAIDNPSLMFVTLFMGILDVRTGDLEFSNGGHNPPYIIHANGKVTPLETTNGMALGVVEDFSYESRKVLLKKGDTLFVFTDGVTEAMNNEEELFSETRLENLIAETQNIPVEQLVEDVMEKIKEFSQGTQQTDDITMMVLRYNR